MNTRVDSLANFLIIATLGITVSYLAECVSRFFIGERYLWQINISRPGIVHYTEYSPISRVKSSRLSRCYIRSVISRYN